MKDKSVILIAGSSGFIGRRLVDSFKKKGYEVWGTHRDNSEKIKNLDIPTIKLLGGEREKTYPNFDIIVNAIGNYTNSHLIEDLKNNVYSNVLAPLTVAEYCGPWTKKFVHLGSYFECKPITLNNTLSQYTQSKILGRKTLADYLSDTSTQFVTCFLYDNYCEDLSRNKLLDQLITHANGRKKFEIKNLTNPMNLTHLDFVVEAIRELSLDTTLDKESLYQIKSPIDYSVGQIVKKIQEYSGHKFIKDSQLEGSLSQSPTLWECGKNLHLNQEGESLDNFIRKMVLKI